MTYKPSKLGQTNLIFGFWSEFIRIILNEVGKYKFQVGGDHFRQLLLE